MVFDGGGFFDTDCGQMIAGAKKYLSAANLLMVSSDFKERPTLLFAPILHLTAHGAELLLKYLLIKGGLTPAEVRKQFGHDLLKLRADPKNSAMKALVLQCANGAWAAAKDSSKWPDKFDGQPAVEFERALAILGRLHSAESDFALRYIVPPNTMAPRPWFLVESFLPAADALVKRPNELDT